MRRPLSLGDEDIELITDPGDEIQRREHAEALRVALADLPERQREAVVLRDLYGLRYGEVAKALGLSRPATEALLFRARRALRQRLRPVVTTAIVVPLSVQEGLAQALPGFTAASSGSVIAGAAGGGLLAKLIAAPTAAKVATAAVALVTVGAVSTAESERASRDRAPHHRVQESGSLADIARCVRVGWRVRGGGNSGDDTSGKGSGEGREVARATMRRPPATTGRRDRTTRWTDGSSSGPSSG